MTLTQLSHASGLPIATTYRLACELVKSGAIERNDDGQFQIGLRLWELGSLAPRQRDLCRVARPMMENLHEATLETVQLAVLENHRALCVEKISGSQSVSNVTEVARGLPLHATSVGKIILAFSEAGLDELAGRRLRRYTPHTVINTGKIAEELARIRREYVAFVRDEFTVGTASAASPIFDGRGEFVAALGVLTSSPPSRRGLGPAVRIAALSISQRLGHRRTGPPLGAHT
ncbi:MAG: IclR family transcriptional regulator [Actinomycetota bacterium]|nr:IclR family transcriptional regulator [Actinomycetota bacterium]